MHAPNPSLAAALTLLRSLAALGLRTVVTSPGSRNTPLLYAADAVGLEVWSVLDERSAAFAALGAARARQEPIALACTSGTASANYAPAVHEASNARVPLLVLTADRPAHLRGIGAPQTIHQVGIYGQAPRWEVDLPPAEPGDLDRFVDAAEQAWHAAVIEQGPVHLNLQFEEPLGYGGDDSIAVPEPPPGGPEPEPVEVDLRPLAEDLGPRPLVLAGDGAGGDGLTALAETVPVIADPLAAERRPPLLLRGDVFARSGLLDRFRPSGVLRLGGPLTSKEANLWLAANADVPQVLVDEVGSRDPTRTASTHLRIDPEAAAWALEGWDAEAGWTDRWRAAESAVESAWTSFHLSDPAVARTVTQEAGDRDLWAASSMPIRDVDAFGTPIAGRIHGTRGANGIDGLLSAAAGAAAATEAPVLAYLGDIAFLHDLGGLVTARRLGVDLTVVVADNDGGAIFSMLPQATEEGPFDLLATPHGMDLPRIASGLADEVTVPGSERALRAAIRGASGTRVVVVRTDRATNRSVHEALWEQARAALASLT